MSYFGEVKIKDNFGWERTVDLEKPLALIGSALSNDICLPEGHGGGVAPIHLQLICSGKEEDSFRLFNISDLQVSILEQASGFEVPLLPGSARLIGKEDVLRIGDFLLYFKLLTSEAVVNEQRTENIGMTLELPETTLHPGEKLSGLISVKNYGARKRCQFEIDLYGLPDDCYQIAPAPLLYPGAEEKLLIRFFHRKTRPNAGPCEIIIRATAAASYPAEQILLHQVINVLPVFDYKMEIEDEVEELKMEMEQEEAQQPAPVQKKPVRVQAVNPEVKEPKPVVVTSADIPKPSRAREAAPVQTSWDEEEVEAEVLQEVFAPPETPQVPQRNEPLREERQQEEPVQKTPEQKVSLQDQNKPLQDQDRPAEVVEVPVEEPQKELEQPEEVQQPQAEETIRKEEVLNQEPLQEPEIPEIKEISETPATVEEETGFEVEETLIMEAEPETPEALEAQEPDLFAKADESQDEESGSESEDDWWGEEDDFQSSLGKRNLNSFNRNVRSRLTRNEIQVIRASKDDDAEELEHE